jgi:hypothetical protein
VLAISLVFIVIGVAEVSEEKLIGWLPIIFFGMCFVVSVSTLLFPAQLLVADQAMTFDHWWRHSTWEFDRCGEFRVWRNPAARQSLVVFEYEGSRMHPRWVRVNGALGAASAGLPENFGLTAPDLAQLLNERRRRRLAGS